MSDKVIRIPPEHVTTEYVSTGGCFMSSCKHNPVNENAIDDESTETIVKAFGDSEIINEIQPETDVKGNEFYTITHDHSISDIRRWLIANDWMEDLLIIHQLDIEKNSE